MSVEIGGHTAVLPDGYTVANPQPMDAGIDAPRVCLGDQGGEGHCFIYHPTAATFAD